VLLDARQLTTPRYFGRAKELPGVRELFQSRKKEEDEDNLALAYYSKFMAQGPAYYGDLDENEALAVFEREAEEEGAWCF
jgi:pre-mRNA-splicing factor ISY1